MKNKITLFFLFFCFFSLIGQEGIQLNTPQAENGYALLTLDGEAVLLDNCGQIVHEWDLESASVSYHCKLLPNGNIIYLEDGFITERDWEGNLVNSILIGGVYCNYEIEILPNGNYLVVGRRTISLDEAADLGFDTSIQQPDRIDVVIEVDPTNSQIVWEWDIRDHLIQDFDADVGNYGLIDQHPRKLNIGALGTYDWTTQESFMINGIDYNPEFDQILLSVRKMSEFIIIDHSTTTEEAAGSTGGNSGHGGDILYRWGNPQNYDYGTANERQLYFQHHPNWIKHGENAGKILVYNNGLNRPVPTIEDRYSSVEIVNPPVNSDGSYDFVEGFAFAPALPELSYNRHTIAGLEFYSSYVSSATVLSNGNIYITEGLENYDFEITPAGDIVWAYQYNNSPGFRTEKYPVDFPAFEGKNLTPMGTIENPASDYVCEIISSSKNVREDLSQNINFSYNIDNQIITIQNNSNQVLQTEVFSLQSQLLQRENSPRGMSNFGLKNTTSGFYFIRITQPNTQAFSTFKIALP